LRELLIFDVWEICYIEQLSSSGFFRLTRLCLGKKLFREKISNFYKTHLPELAFLLVPKHLFQRGLGRGKIGVWRGVLGLIN
jgi:hypothetical protein